MNVLRLVAAAAAMAAPAATAASPAIAELTAEQVAPAPEADLPGPVAFRVAVTARCGDPAHSLSVAAMLGDTLTAWQPADADGAPIELTLEVRRRELGFEPAPLCRRRADTSSTDAVLPGAFAIQVFARCESGDGAAGQRATAAPVSIRYACPDAGQRDDDAVAAPAAPAD